ncbi:MAG: DDE-type integrase/transposase/recombinase [Acetobacteraceae bacterium]
MGLEELFEGRHFDREIIVLCVRWYLRFKLSFWDLVGMMAERGLSIAHTTIMRWVHRYAPELERRNNLIEQDHRGVKLRIGPMLGFKRFRTAALTIAGIEREHAKPCGVCPVR